MTNRFNELSLHWVVSEEEGVCSVSCSSGLSDHFQGQMASSDSSTLSPSEMSSNEPRSGKVVLYQWVKWIWIPSRRVRIDKHQCFSWIPSEKSHNSSLHPTSASENPQLNSFVDFWTLSGTQMTLLFFLSPENPRKTNVSHSWTQIARHHCFNSLTFVVGNSFTT